MPSARDSPPEEMAGATAAPACGETEADADGGGVTAEGHSRAGVRGGPQSSSSCSPCSTPAESRGRSVAHGSGQGQGRPLRSARSAPVDVGCGGGCACACSCGGRPPPLRSARSSPADVSAGRPHHQPPRRTHSRPASCPEHSGVTPAAQPASRPATPTATPPPSVGREVPLLKSVSHAYIATARLQQQLQQYHHLQQQPQPQPQAQPLQQVPESSRLPPLPYPPPAWRAPGSSLDRPVVLENCTPLPPYRACHCGRVKHGVRHVRRRGHHGGGPVVAPAAHVARQAQGHRHHLRAALRVRHGGDGGAADQRADQGAGVAVRHVLGVHDGAGGRAHLRAHDLHVPAAQHRRRQQAAGAGAGGGVAARAHARLHRAGVGLLHGAGPLPLPGRGGHPVLGQVLGLLVHGRVGRHRHRSARAGRVRRLRRALLPQAGRAQVRELRRRHPGARGHQAAARLGHAGALQGVTRRAARCRAPNKSTSA